jgi:ribosomal protein L11 methyltransferase
MQWIKARVIVDGEDPRQTIELVADLFFELGVKGVEMEDPGLTPLEGWGKDAVPGPKEYGVIGYFPDTSLTVERCRLLEAHIQALRHRHGGRYRVTYERLNESDWAEAWKEFFWPERITPHLIIKPTWREFEAEKEDIVLEIDPGMAFGTGSHPTTALCLTLIEKYLQPHDCFLDIGTGSGILMVAAARLGAKLVHGVDNDETAVAVALKNLSLNGIDPKMVAVNFGDLTTNIKTRYNMVTANILSEVILELADDIKRVISPGGLFVCSGIIKKSQKKVLSKLKTVGLEIIEVAEKDEWIAIIARCNKIEKM